MVEKWEGMGGDQNIYSCMKFSNSENKCLAELNEHVF